MLVKEIKMTGILAPEVLQDDLAVSAARAIAVASRRARELGVDRAATVLTIAQQSDNGHPSWQINFGPKDYINRRGGDLIIEVAADGSIRRELRGQ